MLTEKTRCIAVAFHNEDYSDGMVWSQRFMVRMGALEREFEVKTKL